MSKPPMSLTQAVAIAASLVDCELGKRATHEQTEWSRDLRQVKRCLADYLAENRPQSRPEPVQHSNFNL